MTTYQSVNLSALQDFVLNKQNIEKFIIDKIENKLDKEKKNIKQPVNKIENEYISPRFNDPLFWIYVIITKGISYYESITHEGFSEEKNIKIQLVEEVRKNKPLLKQLKLKKTAVENELVNEKQISLPTFFFLCALCNINVVIIDNLCLYKLSSNNDDNYYIIHKNLRKDLKFSMMYERKKYNYIKELEEKYLLIENFSKPLKGVSAYKVDDLVQMCKKLKIQTHNSENEKRFTKKDLWKSVSEVI